MDDLKVKILRLLKDGCSQAEIADIFKNEGIYPNSLSSIEKKLKAIRDEYGAKTMFHLAIILKEETFILDDDFIFDDDDLTFPDVKDS